jgi:hypothetical protein
MVEHMVRNSRHCIVFCVVAFAVATANAAQQDGNVGTVTTFHPLMTPVDGAKEPERIPDFMKHHILFSSYSTGFRDLLVPQISPTDDQILSDTSASLEGWHEEESARYISEVRQLCSEPIDNGYILQVRKRERLADRSKERTAEYYRSVMNSLSAKGRRVVSDFVDSQIAPNMQTVLFDSERWFEDDPEGARRNHESECYRAISGRYSPEDQAIIDENMEIARRHAQEVLRTTLEENQQ